MADRTMSGLGGSGWRARRVLYGAGVVLCALAPATAAQPPDAHVRFATAVELAKGHLTSSRELYVLAQPAQASLHSSHPIQELGNRVIGPIRRADPGLADQIRTALRAPSRSIDTRVPPQQYDQVVDQAFAALDRGSRAVIPPTLRDSPRFQASVIESLLKTAAEEYEESLKSGRIVRPVEYQDAYGFVRRVQALYGQAPGLASQRVSTALERLGAAFPGVVPPEAPVPATRVRGLVTEISAALNASVKPGS
jgi:hypothetical protein